MAALGLWAGLALAVAVHVDRLVAVILLVIVPSAGAWFGRYGPRGFASSFAVHVGYLIGFLVAPEVGTARLGWVGAVIGVSAVAAYVVGLVFLPGHARAPQRMRRSTGARPDRGTHGQVPHPSCRASTRGTLAAARRASERDGGGTRRPVGRISGGTARSAITVR